MKLLVFAHTPPPHHGQSYMVELMLQGLGGDHRRGAPRGGSSPPVASGIECYHVNVQLSRSLEDIGDLRIGKFMLLLGYCLQAIWCRFRYKVPNFYYVPAPGKRSALVRDWLVMALCRPFFRRVILHWHASGLAKWLETAVQIRTRSLTYRFMKQADLSIVLSQYGRCDAEKLYPARVSVVGNGLPDPCPDFRATVLPRRQERLQARLRLARGEPGALRTETGERDPGLVQVLFMGHCTRDKGLFDAVRGSILASETLARTGSPLRLRLVVAGQFLRQEEETEFQKLCREAPPGLVECAGFVSGGAKEDLLRGSDVFCFPSHLESFGLVLAEAMAFGLPIVTTRCGAIPEVMTPGYPALVNVRAPGEIAEAILRILAVDCFEALRMRFEAEFTVERHLTRLAQAIGSVGNDGK